MIKIIAFAGRKQSGKTTCSEFVSKTYNDLAYNFLYDYVKVQHVAKIYNFADPLKQDICMRILGMSHDECYGTDEQKNSLTDIEWEGNKLTAREVMQFVGTDIFRKMKNNVWADATITKIRAEKSKLAIIADCRFPNEVEAVKRAGGFVIKLNRNPHNSDHASEIALDENNYSNQNFDLIINNQFLSIDEQNQTILNFLIKKDLLPK